MRLTNASTGTIALPNGVELRPGLWVDVTDADWKAMATHPVVVSWLKTSTITKSDSPAPAKGAPGKAGTPPPDPGSTGTPNPLA